MWHNHVLPRHSVLTAIFLCASAIQAPAAPGAAFLSYLDDLGDSSAWYVSNFAVKRDSFRTAWKSRSVTRPASGGTMLSLVPAPVESQKDFFGAEIQRTERTHFGRYEVVMTAARGHGVISSFFTYTGAFFGDPHEEIDFEFLGRDTTKVWLNRFVDGQKLPGQWTDLGFDAAEAPHLYTLDWLPDQLVWSVDGHELLRVTSADTEIPQIPQRIYLNIWGGAAAQETWSGEAPNNTRAHVTYHCLSYRPIEVDAPMCSDAVELPHD